MSKFPITHSGLPAMSFGAHWNNRKGCHGKVSLKGFTTVRRYYAGYDKYKVGDLMEIIVKATKADGLPEGIGHVAYGIAEIVDVRVLKVKAITASLAVVDAGLTVEGFKEVLKGMYCFTDKTPVAKKVGKWDADHIDEMDVICVAFKYVTDYEWHSDPRYYLADGTIVKHIPKNSP